MRDKAYLAFVIYNIGLFILVGWSIWELKSDIPLIALLLTMKMEVNK